MTDTEVINEYCRTPEAMAQRLRDLQLYTVTPYELAAVITRVNDGTITRQSAKRVLDVLEHRNRVFLDFCKAS